MGTPVKLQILPSLINMLRIYRRLRSHLRRCADLPQTTTQRSDLQSSRVASGVGECCARGRSHLFWEIHSYLALGTAARVESAGNMVEQGQPRPRRTDRDYSNGCHFCDWRYATLQCSGELSQLSSICALVTRWLWTIILVIRHLADCF